MLRDCQAVFGAWMMRRGSIWGKGSMAAYSYRSDVMFQHCDPAGIVFYPRYFEMINAVVETMFRRINAEFHAPSRLGDVLDWTLDIRRIGGASLDAVVRASCGRQARLTAEVTLVYVDLDRMRSVRWPEDKRALLAQFKEDAA